MYEEEKDKCVQKSILGNQYKRNSIWSHSGEIQGLGCPTISCTIRQTEINRALLDLRESINLLPLLVYQQLGFGELSPTRVTIQLAYPIDFIVLETQPVSNPRSQTPVILGLPIPYYSQFHNQL